jgi:hypothetical protein
VLTAKQLQKPKEKSSFFGKLKDKLPFHVGKSDDGAAADSATAMPVADKPVAAPKELTPETPEEPKKNLVGSFLGKIKGDKSAKSGDDKAYSSLLDSTVESQTNPQDDRILEEAPEFDESLLESIEPPKSILLYVLKSLFAFLVALGLIAVIFFTSQITNTLDFATNAFKIPSVLNQLGETNDDVKELQTELNVYKFLQGKFYLNQITYYGDEYLRNYYIKWNTTMSQADKISAVEKMADLRLKIEDAFGNAAEKLIGNLGIVLLDLSIEDESEFESIFASLLTASLEEKIDGLVDSESLDDKRNHKIYKQTIQLVHNPDLIDLLVSTDIAALTDHEMVALIKQINMLVENELSLIQRIKDKRISWSDVINQIELETTSVDEYFSAGYFDAVGGIQYTSYDFDASTNEIMITGVTKRYDTTNFTMITNLIDELNGSPYFEGVEMSSFTKSGEPGEGYTSTIRLNVGLQEENLEELDDQIDPDALPDFLNIETGVSVNGPSISGVSEEDEVSPEEN